LFVAQEFGVATNTLRGSAFGQLVWRMAKPQKNRKIHDDIYEAQNIYYIGATQPQTSKAAIISKPFCTPMAQY
jgi:hypothetical protein